MKKPELTYEDFLAIVPQEHVGIIEELHSFLVDKGCFLAVKEARNGFVVSYFRPEDKKVAVNYLFRKSGMLMRLYGKHVSQFPQLLEELPENMKKAMDKAGDCKRMLNPEACNSRCSMGYDFILGGKRYQKCRSMAFQFGFSQENNPYLRGLLMSEIQGEPVSGV